MIVLNANKINILTKNYKLHLYTTFSENASYFNYRISMDTKGPINPPSNQNSYIHVIVDAFSHFVVTVPIKQNNAQNAVNSLLHHWITKFGPPVYLVTDRGTEYIKSEFANLCTTMGITHSPRTPYAPWTNNLVENQNRKLGTHLRLFLHNTPENWLTQVHMYAYAHNSQPLSELNLSSYEIVFHTIPRIPINFELNLQRDTYRNCTSQYCQELPLHTHYDKSNLNPFLDKILSKTIPQWILATETAMIKISDITYEIVNQDGYTSHIHRNHLIPYHPKEPVIFPFLQQYNPHLFNDCHSNINDQKINSDEDKLTDDEQFPSTTSNKETDIPFTIDLHPESFSQYSSFPYKQKEQIPQNTYLDNQSDIHDYDNFINPRRHSYSRYNFRPQPRKDYRLFLGENDIISLSQKSC